VSSKSTGQSAPKPAGQEPAASTRDLALAHALAPGSPKLGGMVWTFVSGAFTQLLGSVGAGTLGAMLGTVTRPHFQQAPQALQEFLAAFSQAAGAKS
jgi:hypothetical protein